MAVIEQRVESESVVEPSTAYHKTAWEATDCLWKWKATTTDVTIAAELQPFKHQVAGHSLMFHYEAGVVCKVTSEQEIAFYRTVPDLLRPYVPKFKGVLAVRLDSSREEQEAKGEKSNNSNNNSNNSNNSSNNSNNSGNRMLTLTDRTLRRLEKLTNSPHQLGKIYQFILLENLVEGFHQPCLLDLKLGLKPQELTKVPNSTSHLLGLALCGMKVYQSKTGEVIRLHKADGLGMSEEDFRQTVRHFLYDGHDLRRSLLPSILTQLHKLKAAVGQLSTYRFYSSSLLIVYDAEDTEGTQADIRLVDFARTSHSGSGGEEEREEGVDHHSIRGLQTLIDVFSCV